MFSQKILYAFILILSFCLSRELTADTNWKQLNPATKAVERAGASMAFDQATGQMILFGGQSNSGLINDTWNWNGTTWTQLFPSTSPPARFGASMAFDQSTGQLILFGGQPSSGFFGDTWSWDGTTWTQLFPATSPPARTVASMAFDPATGQLILFGGFNSSGLLADTWNWNGTTWIQLSPATSPSARLDSSMAYDPATGQLILFGGFDGANENDTWSWNGTTWTNITPVNPSDSPPVRSGASMAFDPSTGQMILFGGQGNSGFLGDTWNWDGTTWTQLFPATAPFGRNHSAMAFDPASGQLILFGGNRSPGLGSLDDTWNWGIACPSPPDWTQLTPAASPSARSAATMNFDPATGQMILFGGDAGSILGDTWNWDGTIWNLLTPLNSPPPTRFASMAFDPATGQLILFGGIPSSGFSNKTWNWDGATWTDITPGNPLDSPSARATPALAFDSATGQMILFGGNGSGVFNDTWSWNGTIWTDITPVNPSDSPSARTLASMAFDPATGQLILFGGIFVSLPSPAVFFNETWSWDGINTKWTNITPVNPADSPSARRGASMAFDQATGQLILFGGFNTSGALGDTWSWDGSNWTQLFPADSPSARSLAVMDFDQATGQQILFGGQDSGIPSVKFGDTWNWGVETQIPNVIATPPNQTICSGSTTSIALTSNVPGTTFSWTVIEDGVTGTSDGSGATIAQTLTTISNATGTATYTITPKTGSCTGSHITVVVTVNQTPFVFVTPRQTICSGSSTFLFLSSNVSGTTFSWTVIESGVTGASAGSGNIIEQTLNLTSNATGTATYTITPTSPNCVGSPVTVEVTVLPIPVGTATPSSQTICSGSTTSIALSSNTPDTTFSWTVIESGVTGASEGDGSSIVQTLTTTSNATGTATYTVTPSNGCEGNPIDIVVTVEMCQPSTPTPPHHFCGKIKERCTLHKDIIHVLSWKQSTDPNVVGYRLYQNGKLIKILSVKKTHISLHHRTWNKCYTYSLATFNSEGVKSKREKLTLPKKENCRERSLSELSCETLSIFNYEM